MKTVILPAELEHLDEVKAFAERELAKTPASREDRIAVELAIEEVFVNIVTYASLPKASEIAISCEYLLVEKALLIQFEDEGYPFNPLEWKEPDLGEGLLERGPGGLGIYLLKKMMSEIKYEYDEGCNRLKLWKKFSD